LNAVQVISKVPWLKQIKGFGKIAIFELDNPKLHVFAKEDRLIFSESYDKFWYVELEGEKIYSKPYGMLNSFDVPRAQHDQVLFFYEPQKWANIGYAISGVSLVAIIGFICIASRKRKKLALFS
jgi:hypothetical protein